MEPPTPLFYEKKEIFKAESKYVINSNKNNSFNLIIKNLTSFIEINASNPKDIKKSEFIKKYSLIDLKENKFLSICETIDEIYEELLFEFSKNNSIIIENENNIIVKMPVAHAKYKEINFSINKKVKTDKELYNDLNELVFKLKNEIEEKNIQLSLCQKEIIDLKNIINNINEKIGILSDNNKKLENKIDSLEKEVSILKKDRPVLNNNYQTLNDEFSESKFEEIENPWTNIKEKYLEKFDYILKNRDYYAERKNIWLRYIKAKYKFEKDKIYKLKYNINVNSGRFRAGFGDFGECQSRLTESGSVGLTNEGLYIDGKIENNNIKIEKATKEIIFIINLKNENNKFEIIIDGKLFGEYNFNLNEIYALAAIENGSIEIKTYKKSI